MPHKTQSKTLRRDFEGKEDSLVAARKKAQQIANNTVIQLFKTPEFQEKAPFPYLEHLEISAWHDELNSPEKTKIDDKIYSIMHGGRGMNVSHSFYSMFLDKTRTLRYVNIDRT